ncbi:MAG: tetratricopeptide repeat protein [Phycisphaerae bacterium]|nr:tetratricopeptide repeat protein [Phycisphaerae bacterium]
MRSKRLIVIGLTLTTALVVFGGHAATAADAGKTAAAIKHQFDRHNYKEALQLAEEYVKAWPEGPGIVDVQAMRAICLIKQDRTGKGYRAAEELIKQYPALNKRPDLHQAIGEAARKRGDQQTACRHLLSAVDLYVSAGKKAEAAETLLALAQVFRHFLDVDAFKQMVGQPEPAASDWQARRKACAELVAKTYDRIVALNVDDKTSAEAMFRKGQDLCNNFGGVVPYERAIEAWQKLVATYPKQPRAAEGAFEIGEALHQRLRKYVEAIEQYQKVVAQFPGTRFAQRAEQRIKEIKRPQLALRIQGPTLPGKKAEVHWTARNLKSISLSAYKVELLKMIREFHRPEEFHKWSPPGKADATWTLETPDKGQHEHYNSGQDNIEPTHLPITAPGAYVVVATGQSREGEGIRAVALVLVSRLGVITKTAKNHGLVWAVDSVSGEPKPKTDVLIQRYQSNRKYTYQQATVDDSGLHQVEYKDEGRRFGRQLGFVVRSGDHYAMCRDLYEWGWWGWQYPYRVYGFTERPVYRPEQTVRFKQIVRKHDLGRYENALNEAVKVRIRDPRGKVVYERSLTTNADGSLSDELKLGAEPPLGVYQIEVEVGDRSYNPWDCQGNRFRVEEYKKPEFKVEVAAGKPSYRIGDEIEIKVQAKYYFGEPVAGAEVEYEVWRSEFHSDYEPPRPYPWYFEEQGGPYRMSWRSHGRERPIPGHFGMRRELVTRGKGVTDGKGVATIGPIKTVPYENEPEADLQYQVTARVVDQSRREIRGTGSVKVTHAPFFIHLTPQRHLYKPGDNAQIDIVSKGPNGDAIAFEGKAAIYRLKSKLVEKDDREWREYELGDRIHEADVKVGQDGRGSFRYPFDEEGQFRAIVRTKTKAGDEVTGECDVWICQRGGEYAHFAYRDLELVLDRDSYEIGQTLRLLINTRHENAYVLLTGETDRLLFHRIVFVKGKSALVELPMDTTHTPNFHLMAMALRDDKVFEDRRQVIVPPTQQFLTIEAKANKESYLPREKGQVRITARDSAGKPVSTELAVMMVDASVYYIQPEFREQIQKAFYGQLRPLMVTTRSSFAYSQHGYGRRGGVGGGGIEREAVSEMKMMRDNAAAPAAPAPKLGRTMAMAKPSAEGAAAEPTPDVMEAMVRKEFADSVLWMAHVKTDADGQATVDVTMPDNLTTWTLHAVACDTQTRVGEQSIDVVTKKNLIVRLETPRFLVEKDLVYVSAIVHNYLKTAKKARIELKVTPQLSISRAISASEELKLDGAIAGPTLYRRWVEVPADKEVRIDFVCQAGSAGEATLLAKALTDEESDAMEVRLPVLEYGADKFLAQAGYIGDGPDGEQTMVITVPGEIKALSQSLDVRTSPSIAAVMIDALPYLLEYPYGCTEQTLSRFVPAVVTAKTLQKLGISLEELRKKIERQGGPENQRQLERCRRNPVFSTERMNEMIRVGVKRLADMQQADGGWGWWKSDSSNPYMTAYAIYALVEAREADVGFEASMLQRGVKFLKDRVVAPGAVGRYSWMRDDENVRVWMLFALACENPGNVMGDAKVRAVLDELYKKRDDLTDYGRALLTIALVKLGDRNRATVLIENFDNTARIDQDTQTASWGRTTGWWWWYDSGLETTAMVLRAYLAAAPKHKHIPMIVKWLVRNRRGARWYSTKDTAFCVYALAEYLQASGELDPDMTVTVSIDGKARNTLKITKANVLAVDASTLLGPEDLTPGEHKIEVRKQGRGVVYVGSYLRYYTREDPIKAAGHEVHVKRSYVQLVPKEVEKTRSLWDAKQRKSVPEKYKTIEYERKSVEAGQELASGTLIEVTLEIEAKNNFEYMIFEDPKPAGCEPEQLVSGASYGGGTYANMELRDERVVFFATYLSQGAHKLAYKLRCETPGVFNALPTRAEAMYAPLVRAISDSDRMAIVERK